MNAAARKNFDPVFSFNVAEKLAVNFDFTHPDVSMHDCVFAND